jgi:hypothetical protein
LLDIDLIKSDTNQQQQQQQQQRLINLSITDMGAKKRGLVR